MNKKGQAGIMVGVLAVIGFIAIIIVLMLGYDSVDANHLGVMVNLGKITGTMEPGVQWTGVFTHVYQYDMRMRKEKVDMLTDAESATDKTGQAVFGSISVNFRLKQDKNIVQRLYANIGEDSAIVDKLNLKAIIKEGFKQATVKYEAIDILQNRQQVKDDAIENIKRNFPADYFDLVNVVVEDIDFSPGFKKAIEDKKTATQLKLKEQETIEVVKAQQQQEIEKYKAEAEKMRLQKQEISALLNQQLMLQKWDGKLPQYLIITPESQGLFLQLAKGETTTP